MLTGMLELPIGTEPETAVLLLSPGVKMRVAPHRLYNRMSSWLAGRGYAVLRFDFYGLGDSEGELPEELLADFYREVQLGRFCDDVLSAASWVKEQLGMQRVLLAGLCGGALTGLLASARMSELEGLIALGIPVILDGSGQDHAENMTTGQRNLLKRTYLEKLMDPRSWLRLVTFKTDFRLLLRSFRPNRAKAADQHRSPVQGEIAGNVNPLFAPALFDFVGRGYPLLLVFSGSDRLAWEYEEKFAAPNAERLRGVQDRLDVRTIPNANHVLSDPDSQAQMFEILDFWLAKRFGTRPS